MYEIEFHNFTDVPLSLTPYPPDAGEETSGKSEVLASECMEYSAFHVTSPLMANHLLSVVLPSRMVCLFDQSFY